jgi:hypothetical protein
MLSLIQANFAENYEYNFSLNGKKVGTIWSGSKNKNARRKLTTAPKVPMRPTSVMSASAPGIKPIGFYNILAL